MKEALIIFMVLLLLMLIISVFGGSIRYTNQSPVDTPMRFPRYEQFYSADGENAMKYPIAPMPPAAALPTMPMPKKDAMEKETFADKEDVKNALSSIVDKIKMSTGGAAIEPFESSGEFAAF
jgi:hypothetical protein